MSMTRYRRALLALIATLTVPAAALADPVCEGEYRFAIGGATPAIQGKVSGVPNPVNIEQGLIKVEDCGRSLVIDGDDGLMVLTQDPLDPAHYFGTHQGVTGYFDVWSPDRITGQFRVPGTKSSVIFEMTMIDGKMPDFQGCDSEAPVAEEGSTFQSELLDENRLTVDQVLRDEAIGIVATQLGIPLDRADDYISAARTVRKTRQSDDLPTEIMPGEPGCPIEFEGVKNCLVFPPETTTTVKVNTLLDDAGRLLPIKAKVSDAEPIQVDEPVAEVDYCTGEVAEAKYPKPDRRLEFIFQTGEPGEISTVRAAVVDASAIASSGKIENAHLANVNGDGQRARSDAADEAYHAVGAPVTGRH